MNKAMIERAVNETKECMNGYWRKDRYINELFSDEITWIGKRKLAFCLGKDAIANVQRKLDCPYTEYHIIKQDFWCTYSDKSTCIVMGKSSVVAKTAKIEIISEEIRCTFVWKEIDGKLQICHLHISNPIDEVLDEGEDFSHKISEDTYELLSASADQGENGDDVLAVKDSMGSIRFIDLNKVEAAEANRHNTIVFTEDAEINLRIAWKDFLEKSGESFIRVHRSYAVKKRRIKSIDGKNIVMTSGRKILYVKKYLNEVSDDDYIEKLKVPKRHNKTAD